MKILLFANSSWNLYNFRIGLIESLIKKNHEIYFLEQMIIILKNS